MDSENADLTIESSVGANRLLGLIPMFLLFVIIVLRVSWVLYKSAQRQKTRSTQQRRAYPATRTRQLSMQEPTIFVSPANLPPPPKYEAMAPPSYDEVMGLQYPGFQGQPITQPITHALAQGSTSDIPAVHTVYTNNSNSIARSAEVAEVPATATVINEDRRPSVIRA